MVQESTKEASLSPEPKRRKVQRPAVSNSESDYDIDNKFDKLRTMMTPVSDGSLADRVKRRRRSATRKPTKETQPSTAVEGNQLRIGWSYMRPRLVQPGHVVQHPAVLWVFGQRPLSDD